MKKLLSLILVFIGGITQASADRWVGNSAINANGTWYYAGNSSMTWCTGGAFNGANLGTITALTIGGQSQVWEDSKNWNNGTMTMGYKIDNGSDQTTLLTWYKYENNNNFLQSGGENFVSVTVDLSNLSAGSHTISIWFQSEFTLDNNNSNYYVANFTIPDKQTVSVGTTGIATYSSAYPLDFSSATTITPYTVSRLSETSATLTMVKQLIPAETGLIVMGASNASENITPVAEGTSVGINFLKAAVTATEVSADYAYILYNGEFHPANAGTIPAGKAYLLKENVPTGARALSLVFDNESTGINEVKATSAKADGCYNLAGQRVTAPNNGLYIMNGKKVIVK